jgi:putative sigma-54 modulation protein
MIKCELTARNFELDEKMKEYTEEKIGNLEKYLPRSSRDAITAFVVLEDDPSGREDNRYVCEAIVNIGSTKMVSREATVNFYAAIDIVEAKLKAQLAKYKSKRSLLPRRGRMLGRLTGRAGGADVETPEGELI